ncbi:hypothetical protein KM043_015137 [Ampulex compressa]|nr:hypothetical protein KM043_015137 [Ampulex compressa]
MAVSRENYNLPFMAGVQVAFFLVGFSSLTTAVRVCDSEACHRLSAEIRSNIDTSVNPCDNFFQYACGGWIAKHPLPDGFKSFSRLSIMHEELQTILRELLEEPIKPTDNSAARAVKQQFQSCMDEATRNRDSIIQLLNIVESLSLWPMIHTEGTITKTWQQIHDEFNQMTGRPSLYAVTVYTNKSGSTVKSIFLDQPEFIFDPRLERYTRKGVLKYVDFLTKVVKHFCGIAGTFIPDEVIRKDIEKVYGLRAKLDKLMTHNLRRSRGRAMSIKEAQQFLDNATQGVKQIDAFDAIQTAYRNVKDVTITPDEMIHVREPKYFQGLVQLLSNTPPNVIVNHIIIHFVEIHLVHTSTYHIRLLTELYGLDADRVTYCVNMPNIQIALSNMYIKNFFSAEKRAFAVEIVENVKKAITKQAARTDWFDAVAFNFSMKKVQKLNQVIGYKDAILNDTEVEAYYAEYNMGVDYLHNVLNYEGVEYRRLLRTLRYRSTNELMKRPQEWPISMMILYRSLYNRFELPAGLLRWPYFDIDLANNANYATTGTAAGLTLATMFDSIGYYFNQTGTYVHSISQASDKAHDDRIKCFEVQYNDYVRNIFTNTGRTYNDQNSFLLQTIYDSFGLSVAMEAYEDNIYPKGDEFKILPNLREFNDQKQFFLAFTAPHCETIRSNELYDMVQNGRHTTAELRVNFAVSNLAAFSDIFNCPPGSPMNPSNKCVIFDPPHM